ncbi:MAG: hypothetical protein WD750_04360 [Gammaproteobacteria bacterium]
MTFSEIKKDVSWQIQRKITIVLKFSLIVGAVLLFFQGRYQAVFETLAILFITFLPMILGRRFQVRIPYEFECLAVVFLYASLFLGEVHGYYARFWWWDIVLHTGSGFLLGILGFLLVYVLNEKKEIEMELKPKFIALFALLFAMGMGALWEIFEFAMDQIVGTNMQKPMFNDPSGLTDTMWDLIVDFIGASIISILGWGYLSTKGSESFLENWIDDFIEKNPGLFIKDNDGH